MSKLILFASGMLFATAVYAGDPLFNNNQSAAYTRMFARNASLEIDGVYYNPAGLIYLEKGWNFSLNDQAVFQKYIITNTLSTLHRKTYTGTVKSFSIPSIYAAYRTGDFAFSFGLNKINGNGTLKFNRGLPSYEAPISFLKREIMATGTTTTNYSMDQSLEIANHTYGGQLNISYKINDMFSAAVGARFVFTRNQYDGYVGNIRINPVDVNYNPTGSMILASTYYTEIGDTERAAAMESKREEVKQSGFGLTPIIGVNFNYKKLLLAARYEFQTKVQVKNKTTADGLGIFPNGEKQPDDLPAIFAFGASYDITKTLKLSLAYNHYFSKAADKGNDSRKLLGKDCNDYAIGAEWNFSKLFLVSAGYQYASSVTLSDAPWNISYSFSSQAFAAGGAIKIGNKLRINAGYSYIKYSPESTQITYAEGMSWQETAIETNKGQKHVASIGLDFRF